MLEMLVLFFLSFYVYPIHCGAGQYISTLKKDLDFYKYSRAVITTFWGGFTNQENLKNKTIAFPTEPQIAWELTKSLPNFNSAKVEQWIKQKWNRKLEHLIKWTLHTSIISISSQIYIFSLRSERMPSPNKTMFEFYGNLPMLSFLIILPWTGGKFGLCW